MIYFQIGYLLVFGQMFEQAIVKIIFVMQRKMFESPRCIHFIDYKIVYKLPLHDSYISRCRRYLKRNVNRIFQLNILIHI